MTDYCVFYTLIFPKYAHNLEYFYYTPQSDNFQLFIVNMWDNSLSKKVYFMNILSNISERLKDLMSEAQLNNTSLANKTGIHVAVISRILSCDRMPSYKTLITLVDFFNCTADYLLGRKESWNEQTFKPCPPFSEQLDFLLKTYKISKYRLEKETGLKEETVNRWHSGKYDPTVEHLIKLADNFECSVDYILGREI